MEVQKHGDLEIFAKPKSKRFLFSKVENLEGGQKDIEYQWFEFIDDYHRKVDKPAFENAYLLIYQK